MSHDYARRFAPILFGGAALVFGTACSRAKLMNAEEHLIPPSSRMLDDSNILGMLIDSDSSEVMFAEDIRGKLSDPRMRSYAQTLIDDHSRSKAELHALAQQTGMEIEHPPIDTIPRETRHLITEFDSMPAGHAFDTAFVNHEVRDHHKDLGDAQKMAEWAKNAQLKATVTKSLGTLEKHLRMAEELGGQP